METIDNLPSWPGAAICYSRAYKWMQAVANAAWTNAKSRKAYRLPEDVDIMRQALNVGDEETIKALNHTYRNHWLA